jgi:hypothetical protein
VAVGVADPFELTDRQLTGRVLDEPEDDRDQLLVLLDQPLVHSAESYTPMAQERTPWRKADPGSASAFVPGRCRVVSVGGQAPSACPQCLPHPSPARLTVNGQRGPNNSRAPGSVRRRGALDGETGGGRQDTTPGTVPVGQWPFAGLYPPGSRRVPKPAPLVGLCGQGWDNLPDPREAYGAPAPGTNQDTGRKAGTPLTVSPRCRGGVRCRAGAPRLPAMPAHTVAGEARRPRATRPRQPTCT